MDDRAPPFNRSVPSATMSTSMSTAKKSSLVYRCVNCGHTEPKWLGRCPECGQWNSLREGAATQREDKGGETFPLPIAAIDPGDGTRISTGMPEMDRVLGGGLMRGSAVLLGGEPGIGKSTLLLQACARCDTKGRILYVSGEESPAQIRLRAERLGCMREGIEVFCSGELPLVRAGPRLAQALGRGDRFDTDDARRRGGRRAGHGESDQVLRAGIDLVGEGPRRGDHPRRARDQGGTHRGAEGRRAPRGRSPRLRARRGARLGSLRASKNRFGSAEEVGLFRMGEAGLEEIADASGLFMIRHPGEAASEMPPGAAVAPVHEGSRILLVEIQALTVSAKAGLTRVYSERIDSGRVSRVAAVLEKHAGARFSDQDIYVNVAGGMRLTEPGIDLALACALYSARSSLALPAGAALAGELSLAGEVRPVRHMRRRAKAALSLGFDRTIGPAEEGAKEWTAVSDLKGALRELFGKG